VSAVDDTGVHVPVPHRVRRVVSLVPSLTESVAVTDRDLLVGATDWCSHPADLTVVRVGGTKNPDLATVAALAPDVVLANEEENRRPDLDALRTAGIAVWVTSPRSVDEALESLSRMVVDALRVDPEPPWLTEAREAWSAPDPPVTRRALVPIWRRPWMALGRDTFAGDVLRRCGVDNVLAAADERYPRFALADVAGLAPDLVVLPDEPYAFSGADGPEAFPGLPCALVSGRMLTWYGPSLAAARSVLTDALALPGEPGELPDPGGDAGGNDVDVPGVLAVAGDTDVEVPVVGDDPDDHA
jgi:ABC-type hemin transport system substrate-binding protein